MQSGTRGEGDCLQMGRDAGGEITADGTAGSVSVGSWDSCMLPYIETGNGLNELRTRVEIGVGDAAVPRPKLVSMVSFVRLVSRVLPVDPVAVLQGSWQRGLGRLLRRLSIQISFQEGGVADLVIGVVVDVLCHVAVENRKGRCVREFPPFTPETSLSWVPPSSLY